MHCKYKMVILASLKRGILLAVLMAFTVYPSIVCAEWTLYASSDESGADLYYLPESVNPVNDYYFVETLSNYRETQVDKYDGGQMVYKSEVNKQYIDCRAEKYANLSWDMYPEWNAQGEVDHVRTGDLSWKSVKRNSVQEELLKKVCAGIRA